MQHHHPTDTERFDYTELSGERQPEPAIAPARTSSLLSSLVSLAVFSVIAALGVYEFSVIRDHWPDLALEIAGKQLFIGVVLLPIGGLLNAVPLRGDSHAPPSVRGAIGKLALVAGGILTIAALAGLLYVGAMELGAAR
ncbi:MAG: hypothetical protein EOO25_17435 [Comamonadaceae bacterium]|nr:MAG: hypothetical protein EOO25_17435 [Comamonadaceae bacterium]